MIKKLKEKIRKRREKKKGFTLVELLAVIVILAVIMVITIPSVLGNMNKAKQSAFNTVGETIKKYLEDNYKNCKLGNKDIAKFDEEIFEGNCELKDDISEKLIINSGYSTSDIKDVDIIKSNDEFSVVIYPNDTGKYSDLGLKYDSSCWSVTDNMDGTYKISFFRGIDDDGKIKDNCTGYVSKNENGYSINIPSKVGGKNISGIGISAFYHNQLTSVTIPNSVTTIGDYAFSYNQLTSLTIPDSVTTIEKNAFSFNQLTSVTIPNSVTTIGEAAFHSNQLTSVTVSDGVTTIGASAFSKNQLTSITIPNSVTTIGDHAFSSNQLTSVTISNSLTTIGDYAFSYNQLTSVIIPNSVTAIGDYAFSSNQLTSVTIPNSLTIIGKAAFSSNQLTSVTIPNSVTTIGDHAFSNNQLTSVTIPNSVTTIGATAFSDNQLTSVTIPNSVTTIGDYAFSSNELTYPVGSPLFIHSNVTFIGEKAFGYNINLKQIKFSGSEEGFGTDWKGFAEVIK